MNAGTSQAALLARLEREISNSVEDLDQILMQGLPTRDESLRGERHSIKMACITANQVNMQDARELLFKGLLPLSAAFAKLPTQLRATAAAANTPPGGTVLAAAFVSELVYSYIILIGAALQEAPANQVKFPTLLKLLEPLAQIEFIMPLLKRAYEETKNCTHPPGTVQFEKITGLFQGTVCSMFLILFNLVKILLASPLVIPNRAKIQATGVCYVNEDALWSWMDECTDYAANLDTNGNLDPRHGELFLRFSCTVTALLTLSIKDIEERRLEVFYDKNYDECYLRAFEYIAQDRCHGIFINPLEYVELGDDINQGLSLILHHPESEYYYISGGYQALEFSGSVEVQERIFNACSKIFNNAFERHKRISSRDDYEAKLLENSSIPMNFALVVNALSLFGLKRYLFGQCDRDDTPLSPFQMKRWITGVAKGDILRSNAWMELYQMRKRFSESYFPYRTFGTCSDWLAEYSGLEQGTVAYNMCFFCGKYLTPNDEGEYTILELHFRLVDKLFNMITLWHECARQLARVQRHNPNNFVVSLMQVVQKILEALFNTGIFQIPQGDKRLEIVWDLYKNVALSNLKAVRAFISVPMDSWDHLKKAYMMDTRQGREKAISTIAMR